MYVYIYIYMYIYTIIHILETMYSNVYRHVDWFW